MVSLTKDLFQVFSLFVILLATGLCPINTKSEKFYFMHILSKKKYMVNLELNTVHYQSRS